MSKAIIVLVLPNWITVDNLFPRYWTRRAVIWLQWPINQNNFAEQRRCLARWMVGSCLAKGEKWNQKKWVSEWRNIDFQVDFEAHLNFQPTIQRVLKNSSISYPYECLFALLAQKGMRWEKMSNQNVWSEATQFFFFLLSNTNFTLKCIQQPCGYYVV